MNTKKNLLDPAVVTNTGGLIGYWGGTIELNYRVDGYECFTIYNNPSNGYGDGFIAAKTRESLVASRTYLVSGFIWVPSGRYFIVRQRDNSSGGGHDGIVISGNSKWQYFSYSFTATSSMTYGQIEGFECDSSGAGYNYSNTAYHIRDLRLVEQPRTNIMFSTDGKIYANEFAESISGVTDIPFNVSDGHTVCVSDIAEDPSISNITYSSDKKLTCKSFVEGNPSDYITLDVPTLSWTPDYTSGTLKITNTSYRDCKFYYGTNSSSVSSGGEVIAPGKSKSVSISTSGNTYYAKLVDNIWGEISGPVSSGCLCRLNLRAPVCESDLDDRPDIKVTNRNSVDVDVYINNVKERTISKNNYEWIMVSEFGKNYSVKFKKTGWNDSAVTTGHPGTRIAKPSCTTVGATVTIYNNSAYTVYPVVAGTKLSSSVGPNKSLSHTRTTTGPFSLYMTADGYVNSEEYTGHILASPSFTLNADNVVSITNRNNFSCTLYVKLPGASSYTSQGTVAGGASHKVSYTKDGTVYAYLQYSSSSFKSSTKSKDVSYFAPSTTR